MAAVDLQAGRVGLPVQETPVDGSLAADLSVSGLRERAFRRELHLIAEGERAKAARLRVRASRLALNSNGRQKKLAEAARLEEHAGVLDAATVST